MKTTANLLKALALLAATLLTACASSAGPSGPTGARTATREVDRYYDPVSQDWVMTNK